MLGHNVAGAQSAYTLILSSTQMQQFLFLQLVMLQLPLLVKCWTFLKRSCSHMLPVIYIFCYC